MPITRCAVLACLLAAWPAVALALPSLTLAPIATLTSPLYVTHAGDERLFIVERDGRILIYVDGQGVLPTPFLDIRSLVDDSLDGGLFAMAFHPDYAANGYFFVSYTETGTPLRSVIARYRVSDTDPNLADPASAAVLTAFDQPGASHNNNQVAFGPHDGHLYVSFGDGGQGGGPECRSQRDDGFFGKLVRLDVGQSLDGAPFYGIPPSNPFADPGDGILDEIWAKGFRNPWRFSFHRATGDLFVADVGQDAREEIDRQPAASPGGENYGWKVMEGTTCFDPDPIDPSCPAGTPSCFDATYTPPIFEYATGADCSVIGGYVHRGSAADARGLYVFGDFCSGRIWALEETTPGTWVRTEFLDAAFGLTSFGQDRGGEIYVTIGATVSRLDFDGPTLTETCGDGVLVGAETCDDDNTAPRDGCDATCRREVGFRCVGEPSVCTARLDHYVVYAAKASPRTDLPDNGKFKLKDWNVRLDDVTLANGNLDDPENYAVRRDRALVLPAVTNAGPALLAPELHYVQYQVKEAKEGAGPYDVGAGRYPRALRHQRRTWRLANQLGTIGVATTAVKALWVPAAKDLAVQPPVPANATHYLCYRAAPTADVTGQTPDGGGGRGRFRKDLQVFVGDQFLDVDCAVDRAGAVPFENTPVEGTCLFTLKTPKLLCNPVVKQEVGGTPPRVSVATIDESAPAESADSLLCYKAKLASRLRSQDVLDAGLLAGQTPPAALGDGYRQTRHVRRTLAGGTAPFVTPGNGLPAPLQADTRKADLVCIPTRVHGVV